MSQNLLVACQNRGSFEAFSNNPYVGRNERPAGDRLHNIHLNEEFDLTPPLLNRCVSLPTSEGMTFFSRPQSLTGVVIYTHLLHRSAGYSLFLGETMYYAVSGRFRVIQKEPLILVWDPTTLLGLDKYTSMFFLYSTNTKRC